MYRTTFDYQKANLYYVEAYTLIKDIDSSRLPDYTREVGQIMCMIGKSADGVHYLEKARDITLQIYGEEHRETARMYNFLAKGYLSVNRGVMGPT